MTNTFILIGSSVTMVMAWAALKMGDWGKHRLYLISTFVLAGIFLVNKYFEYSDHFARGEGPWHSNFLALYFTLTGLHGRPGESDPALFHGRQCAGADRFDVLTVVHQADIGPRDRLSNGKLGCWDNSFGEQPFTEAPIFGHRESVMLG